MKEEKDKKDTRMARGMIVLYLLLTVGVGIAILLNVVNIQFVHGDEWRARGERREAGLRTDPARRGVIYSSDGNILATTVTECDLYLDLDNKIVLEEDGRVKLDRHGQPVQSGPIVDSSFTKYLDTVCEMLSDACPQHSASYYRERIATERTKEHPRRCFLVQRGVPYSVWLQICRLPGWNRGVVRQVDGQSVVHQVRAHIYGNLAENTIGFRNRKDVGSYTGLEGYYDSILRGQDGLFNCRRLTKGIWLPDEPGSPHEVAQRTDQDRVDTVLLQRRVDGGSIVATIDTRYQDVAETSLREVLRRYGGTAGCAILMEMHTGYVLACANLAIDTSVGDYREMRDRNVAVSDVYEPGSTFKTVVLTAMLEDSEVKIDTSMRLPAGYKDFGGKNGEIRDDHGGWDSLSLKGVIEQSSNVGMCDLGWKLYGSRRDTLRHLVQSVFPYGEMRVDVKAPEYRTYVNDLSRSNRDFLNFCYGYSTRVSALQLITFYNAIGAGGRMVKPLFCRAVIDGNGHRREIEPVVLKERMCSGKTASIVQDMLEGVVENGTGNNVRNATYGIAGKTGTAVHNYAERRRYNASFAGYFPAENPRYTCLVMVEDVPAYGRQAATVFKRISDAVVAMDGELSSGGVRSAWPRLEVDSSRAAQRPVVTRGKGEDVKDLYGRLGLPYRTTGETGEWVEYRAATDTTEAVYDVFQPSEGVVPRCYGMSAKDAVELLEGLGYKVSIEGYGKVMSQSPRPGERARQGRVVNLKLR